MVPAPDGRVSGARTAGLRAARLHGGAALLAAPRLTAVAPSLWRASGGVLGAGGSATTTRHWCALAPPRPAAILPLLGQRAPSARRGNLSLTDFSAVGKASSWSPRDPLRRETAARRSWWLDHPQPVRLPLHRFPLPEWPSILPRPGENHRHHPANQFIIVIQISSTINYLPPIFAATTLFSQRQAEPALCEVRAHRQSV